jgi:hypothetical protein
MDDQNCVVCQLFLWHILYLPTWKLKNVTVISENSWIGQCIYSLRPTWLYTLGAILFSISLFQNWGVILAVIVYGTGSWIYNYLCNQCLSPLILWVRISIREWCTTICYKVCQRLATGQCFFFGSSDVFH